MLPMQFMFPSSTLSSIQLLKDSPSPTEIMEHDNSTPSITSLSSIKSIRKQRKMETNPIADIHVAMDDHQKPKEGSDISQQLYINADNKLHTSGQKHNNKSHFVRNGKNTHCIVKHTLSSPVQEDNVMERTDFPRTPTGARISHMFPLGTTSFAAIQLYNPDGTGNQSDNEPTITEWKSVSTLNTDNSGGESDEVCDQLKKIARIYGKAVSQ